MEAERQMSSNTGRPAALGSADSSVLAAGFLRSMGITWGAGVLLCGAVLPFACAQSSPAVSAPGQGAERTASVQGFVEDVDGAVIPGAHIAFSGADGSTRTVSVGADGGFQLEPLPAGAFELTVSAAGFAVGTVTGTLLSNEHRQLAAFRLPAGTTEAVDVTISQREVATAEVHEEEHQRLIGVIPNFFVVYDWHAPPLTTRQKYELSWKTMSDPVTLGVTAGIAGVQQATGNLSGYGQGAQGYGKRLGAGLADETIGTLLGGAVLPALLHQDPRYFYKGTGSVRSRFLYALSTAVIAKGDNGKWQPAYAGVAGDLAAGALSNLYYPANDRSGVGLTFKNGFIGVALDGVQNVIQEFLLKHLTPKISGYSAP